MEGTNMLSQANMRRLYGHDSQSIEQRTSFFHLLNTDASFPAKVRAGFNKMMPDSFEFEKPLQDLSKLKPADGPPDDDLSTKMSTVIVR